MTQPLNPPSVGWTDRQLRVLAALCATIVEPAYEVESYRHALLAAGALSDVAEPSDVRQLQLLLNLLEAPIGLPGITGGRAFSKMSRQSRERLLHAWSTSRIGQRRTFFQTIKRLGAFFAYADPGLEVGNPRWKDIGYDVPDHPIADGGPVAAAIIRPPGWPLDVDLDAEVVVVGSGAAGGVVAARLAEAGHDVLVVESGPYVPENEMPTDELGAFTRLYLDHGMTSTTDLGIAILAGAGLGGGTLVNWATCFAPPERVRLEWAHRHGIEGFDGEGADKDISRMRTELGFAAPSSVGTKDQAIIDGTQALGWEGALAERNADGCGDCGACGFGCRRGAKRSGQRLHLASAVRHGARILANAPVDRIQITNGRASGVSGLLGGGRRFIVNANKVVVAAGALRTPVIMLRSGLVHEQVGRNLHLHPTAAVGGRFDRDVLMWRGTMQAARSLELIEEGVLIESAPAHPGLIALAFPWQGAARQDELMRDIRQYAPFIGIVRDADAGCVSLSRSGRARIDYRVSARDADKARKALVAMARIARAAGANRVVALGTPAAWHDVEPGDDVGFDSYLHRLARFDFAPNRGALFSAHQMGSVRAGGSTCEDPCDPWGRIRGTKPAYVADASLFPTAIGVNPMVTVMAMAARVARAVHEDSAN